MDPVIRQHIYHHVLEDRLCLRVEVMAPGVLGFDFEGAHLTLTVSDPCVEYVRIAMAFSRPAQFTTDALLRVAHEVGQRQKVAKVAVFEEMVLISVEAVVAGAGELPSREALASLLARLLTMVVAAGVRLQEELVLLGIASAE